MTVVRKSSLYFEWANNALGTSPSISMEIVNASAHAVARIKSIFERTLGELNAMHFVDSFGLYEFDETQCAAGKPFKLHFIHASFGKMPLSTTAETMRLMTQRIAQELTRQMSV